MVKIKTIKTVLATSLLAISSFAHANIVPVATEKIKKIKPLYALALVMFAGTVLYANNAHAEAGNGIISYHDTAQVMNVEAVYRTIYQDDGTTPCHTHSGNYEIEGDGNPNNEIIGAIIGGVLGNQIAKNKSHRGPATVIGAIGGAVIGSSQDKNRVGTSTHTVCDKNYNTIKREEVWFYRVTYNLNGQRFVMDHKRRPQFNERKVLIKIQVLGR